MTYFEDADLEDLINRSFQMDDTDVELIRIGWEHAKTKLRPRQDYETRKDLLVQEGLCTEFIFNCIVKGKESTAPLMKADVPNPIKIVTDIGPEKTILAQDFKIDRFTGFAAVALAEKVCSIKQNMLDDGIDVRLVSPDLVKKALGNYDKIDNFRPPQVESKVDDNMIAIYKRTYADFLDTVVTGNDKVLYIEGDFGAAGLRRLNHIADCLYFNEVQYKRSLKDRKVNNTAGEDFFYEYGDGEWKSLVRGYTVVIHNFLFGKLYDDLLKIQKKCSKMSLIATGVNPDRKDTEIYRLQKKKSILEAYEIDVVYAEKYGMQIMYEDDLLYVVYFDHGRYEDIRPHGYEIMVPFVELNSWEQRRCYRAFNHLALFITGPLGLLYQYRYLFSGNLVEIRKLKKETLILNDECIYLPGIPDSDLMLLDGGIIDYKDIDRPYWLRRHKLKQAGVIFCEPVEPVRTIRHNAGFDCLVSLEESSVLDEIREKPISPFIEVRGIGWNPHYDKLVYDAYCKSIITPHDITQEMDKSVIRVSVVHDEIEDTMTIVTDSFGDFVLYSCVSFSRDYTDVISDDEKEFFLKDDDDFDSSEFCVNVKFRYECESE